MSEKISHLIIISLEVLVVVALGHSLKRQMMIGKQNEVDMTLEMIISLAAMMTSLHELTRLTILEILRLFQNHQAILAVRLIIKQ